MLFKIYLSLWYNEDLLIKLDKVWTQLLLLLYKKIVNDSKSIKQQLYSMAHDMEMHKFNTNLTCIRLASILHGAFGVLDIGILLTW